MSRDVPEFFLSVILKILDIFLLDEQAIQRKNKTATSIAFVNERTREKNRTMTA